MGCDGSAIKNCKPRLLSIADDVSNFATNWVGQLRIDQELRRAVVNGVVSHGHSQNIPAKFSILPYIVIQKEIELQCHCTKLSRLLIA